MYDDIAYYYHLTHQQLDDDIPFILATAKQANGAILELGCGTGRLLRPLAQAGYTAVGIDLSEQMLAIAKELISQDSDEIQERIQLVHGDMSNFSFSMESRFDLCLIPYNTVMHLSGNDLHSCLRQVKKALLPNGRLLIDTINPHMLAEIEDQEEFMLENELFDPEHNEMVRVYGRYRQQPNQTLSLTWRFQTADSHVDGHSLYHYRYPHQLQLALQQSGFRVKQMWGDYDSTPFNEEAPRCLILAAR